MYNLIFWILVTILLLSHFSGMLLESLNRKTWSDRVPEKLSDIIDQEDYSKSQKYYLANLNFGNIISTFNLLVILAVLFFFGFSILDRTIRDVTSNEILVSILFFAVVGFTSGILSIPFSWYSTFVIEERFGFNRTTPKLFASDLIRGWILTAVIGTPLIWVITWFFYYAGPHFWVLIWVAVTLFSIFMNVFYSDIIVPLFNRQKKLEPGSLRSGIEDLAKKAGFRIHNIYTIDGSRRSTKSNAYFSGLGPRKRIVLYDTLIDDLTEEEVIAVLAHEIGHYRKRHSPMMLLAGIIQTGLLLFIFAQFSQNMLITEALGGSSISFHLSLVGFLLIYSPVSLLISIGFNYVSRANEYAADRFAADVYHPEYLASALKKLSVKNLSNLNPHPLYVFFYYRTRRFSTG
ncbi:MAG: M48 family metallopeptidase [Bacteroidales bacterium]